MLPVTLFVLYYLHNQHQPQQPVRIIEQRTIMVLPSGNMSRREFYQMISNGDIKQLEGRYENA